MENKMLLGKQMTKRSLMALAGTVLTGLCVGAMQKADLGVDPFTCLVTAVAKVSGQTYGVCFFCVTAVLLLGAWIWNRRLVGIATVLNLLICGFAADFMNRMLSDLLKQESLPGRLFLLIVSLGIVGFSTSLYFTADIGVSAYDAVALTLSERTRKMPFQIWRVMSDLFCVIVGYICGVSIGIGTLITALMMGPVIQWFNKNVSEKILQI